MSGAGGSALLRNKVQKRFVPRQAADVLGDRLLPAQHRAGGPAAHVRGHDEVGQLIEGELAGLGPWLVRRWIIVPGIDDGAADPALLERTEQSLFVDHGAAADVE